MRALSPTWRFHELGVTGVDQCDTDPWTIACVSGPDAVIAADAAYDGNQSHSGCRSAWEPAEAMMAMRRSQPDPCTLPTVAKAVFEQPRASIVVSTLTTRQAASVPPTRV